MIMWSTWWACNNSLDAKHVMSAFGVFLLGGFWIILVQWSYKVMEVTIGRLLMRMSLVIGIFYNIENCVQVKHSCYCGYN